ncbi:uncharacterized protein [Linepithema humile]|uniref:uncharacterized protein n=1 Tax=Linepithema humile TaxID=83485 RepID=UPI00351F710F
MADGIRRCLPHPVLVTGDFNAWSTVWGSWSTNAKGRTLLKWTAEMDLLLLNRGSTNTCVRPRGWSIVDLTWATPPAARLVSQWGVSEGEFLSDHWLIEMVLSATPREMLLHRRRADPPRRWALSRLDLDRLIAAAKVETWSRFPGHVDTEEEAVAIRGMAAPRRLFNNCLRSDAFPFLWKEANLVLLRKEGKPAEQPSAYRPICLLNEVGKFFERVIAGRIVQHLSRTGPDLSEAQFGFRERRSTVDAIMHLKALSERITEKKVALAVSLDIVNAFNFLPWEFVGEAVEYHGFPQYIREVVWDYFRDRTLQYRDGLKRIRISSLEIDSTRVLRPVDSTTKGHSYTRRHPNSETSLSSVLGAIRNTESRDGYSYQHTRDSFRGSTDFTAQSLLREQLSDRRPFPERSSTDAGKEAATS